MRELYVDKFEKGVNLAQMVPVHMGRKKFVLSESFGYSEGVKRRLQEMKSELLDFRKFSEGRNLNDSEIRSRFNGIVHRMAGFIHENGCFYPDSLVKDVISLGLESGGSAFGILFQTNNVRQDIERLSKNCKFLIQ